MSDTPTVDAPMIPIESAEGRRVVGVICEDFTGNAEAWTNDEIAKIERESVDVWAKVEDANKRAMAVIARDCLIRLMENPLEWLPTSLLPQSGTKIGLFFFINLDDVEAQVVEMRQQAEIELQAQVENISALRERLDTEEFNPPAEGDEGVPS